MDGDSRFYRVYFIRSNVPRSLSLGAKVSVIICSIDPHVIFAHNAIEYYTA